MGMILAWIALAFIVGVAANTRGRNGAGWFLISAVASPLLAGLFLIALPSYAHETQGRGRPEDDVLYHLGRAQRSRRSIWPILMLVAFVFLVVLVGKLALLGAL